MCCSLCCSLLDAAVFFIVLELSVEDEVCLGLKDLQLFCCECPMNKGKNISENCFD